MCTNKPLVLVDKGPWYKWALERLGPEYRYERFFRYLKERTMVFNHKVSARDRITGNKESKTIPKPHSQYTNPAARGGG
jgi:transposase-like protein